MRADPNGKVPTPGAVFRHLGCRPRCGGCFPAVIDIIHEKSSEETGNAKPVDMPRKRATGR
nr:hypothetical protein [Roseibium sp. Sym1]